MLGFKAFIIAGKLRGSIMKDLVLVIILFLVFIGAGVYMEALNLIAASVIACVGFALAIVSWWGQPNYK